jgi:hypothetical protein
MKFAVIAAAILSSISRAVCFETTSHGSAGPAPGSLMRSRLKDRIDPRSANALRKVLRGDDGACNRHLIPGRRPDPGGKLSAEGR